MNIGRASSFLGVAVSDRGVSCAEIAGTGSGRHAVRRTATFTFPPELSLDTPDAAGQALAAFLRQKRFSTTRAVAGVPARWLIAVEKEVPPADEEQARAALRLQAERLAVAEHGEVVFDFAGKTESSAVARVLLVGMLRQRLENVERLLEAAGMNVVAVTSTGLALASAASSRGGDGGVLALVQGGGELVWRAAGAPRMLRHVPLATNGNGLPPATPLGSDLRRMVAMAPSNGSVASRSILLLDGIGLEPQQVSELSDRLGVPVKSGGSGDALGISSALVAPADLDAADSRGPGRFAPAMALALTGARPELMPLDFMHSRLTPPRVQRIGRTAIWGGILAAAVLLFIVSMYVLVSQKQSDLDALNAQLAELKPAVASSKGAIDRLTYGRGFFDTRPPVLDCLREVAQSFRDDEPLWATGLTFRENRRGTLTGRAADQRIVLALLGRLQKSPRFSEVKAPDLRQADTRSGEWSFTISFVFNDVE
ncbi:MAG TPA: PilN domain-containing protein [Tepidisphaeraceae bacterium]|nr:PilN domain-containing protein [Tepidisphaeraceae bacterium]